MIPNIRNYSSYFWLYNLGSIFITNNPYTSSFNLLFCYDSPNASSNLSNTHHFPKSLTIKWKYYAIIASTLYWKQFFCLIQRNQSHSQRLIEQENLSTRGVLEESGSENRSKCFQIKQYFAWKTKWKQIKKLDDGLSPSKTSF